MELSDDIVRAGAKENAVMLGIAKLVGVDMNVTNAKAKSLLGWTLRTPNDAIVATAQSFIELGLLKYCSRHKDVTIQRFSTREDAVMYSKL